MAKKLPNHTLMQLGQHLQRVFEPVTKLPLTDDMTDALARLDLMMNSRVVARNIGKAVA